LSLLSTPVLDSFFPYPPPLLPRLSWAGWWTDTGQDEWLASQVRVDEGGDETRLVRIGWADVGEILDRDEERTDDSSWTERDFGVLNIVRQTVEEWERKYQDTGEGCVRQLKDEDGDMNLTGDCYFLSPNRASGATVLSDLTMLNGSTTHPWPATDDGQIYRSLAALFHVPASSQTTFDGRWLEAMEAVASQVDGEVFLEAPRPHLSNADQKQSFHISVSIT